MRNLTSIALVVWLLLGTTANASTGFSIVRKARTGWVRQYAISTGWYTPARGAVTLNPRNMHRIGALKPASAASPEWVSRYWSLTQTMYGAGFPMSGVNEKGLVIQATVLRGSLYPPVPAGSMMLQRAQWIQYNLDNSGSLAEVLAKTVTGPRPIVPQDSVNAEFQVCDSTDCAVIAYFDGKAVAYGSIGRIEVDLTTGVQTIDRDKRWPWATIANHSADASIAAFERCRGTTCTDLDDSDQRFARLTNAAQSYGNADADMSQIFADLKTVDQGYPKTIWNEVYTIEQRGDGVRIRLTYKAPGRPLEDAQWISVASDTADVVCNGSIRLWWIDLDKNGGDRTAASVTLDRAAQETLAFQHDKTNGGMFPHSVLAPMATAPETNTRCVVPQGS